MSIHVNFILRNVTASAREMLQRLPLGAYIEEKMYSLSNNFIDI
jgi:hypothetical protein